MTVFIEAVFLRSLHISDRWRDESTQDYFIFTSEFGALRLRKRTAYPKTFAYTQGPTLYFGYGELPASISLERPLHVVSNEAFTGEEFLYAAADCHEQSLTVQRDAISTVPLFVGHQADRVVMSNKYERVYNLLDAHSLRLHQLTLVRHLLAEPTYDKTFVAEIRVLCDRMRLSWDRLRYNLYHHHNRFMVITDSNTEPGEFRARFDDALITYWQRYAPTNRIGLELSGGLDSSAIAAHLVHYDRRFLPCSIIYPGEFGKLQQRKLAELSEALGILSRQFPADPATDYPLATYSKDLRSFYHRDELYGTLLSRMSAYMRDQGVTAVIRGVGGDELCENIPNRYGDPIAALRMHLQQEGAAMPRVYTQTFKSYALAVLNLPQENLEGQPFTSATAAGCAASGNNVYLDHDIWPIAPLTDPKLYKYSQALAPRYRMSKHILRAYAAVRHVPSSIAHPETIESFSDFFHRSLPHLQNQFGIFFQDSALARAGFIDLEQIEKSWGSQDKSETFALYQIIVAEMNLRLLKLA